MSKKIFLTLMLGLISSNSLYAMEDIEETFSPTRTVQIKSDLWAHLYVTHNAVRAKAKAWVTKDAGDGSQGVPIESIRLDLDIGGRPLSKTVHNTDHVDLEFKGSSPSHTTALAWFTNPDFGTFGPVKNVAKLTDSSLE
jgi:hypothetical protein